MKTVPETISNEVPPEHYNIRDEISHKLDVAKQWNNIQSDYALAKKMGITQSALINYRRGKTLPDERAISELCKLTGEDPHWLAAHVQAERAKTKEAKELWRGVARQLSALHVAVAVTTLLGFTTTTPSAHAGVTDKSAIERLYIM